MKWNLALLASLMLTITAGCGGEDAPAAVSVMIVSGDIYGDELLLSKGDGALVSLKGADAAGAPAELQGDVSWTSSDADVVSVTALGDTTIAEGLVDWFDYSAVAQLDDDKDPCATITGSSNGLSASIDVCVILDVGGLWTVTVGTDAPVIVPFLQNGRVISQPLADMEGEVHGATLVVETPDVTMSGTFTSLTEVSGTAVDAQGVDYEWSAVK